MMPVMISIVPLLYAALLHADHILPPHC